MTPLAAVARAAQVSPTAVSAVLHGGAASIRVSTERQAAILAAARDLAYRPNEDIAVVVRVDPQRSVEGPLLFTHALQALAPGRVQLQVADGEGLPDVVRRWKVGGVVAFDDGGAALVSHCRARGLPCLHVNPPRVDCAPAIHVGDEVGVALAGQALVDGGCTSLALCAPAIRHQAHVRRVEALRQVARERKVPIQIADAPELGRALADLDLVQPGLGILVLSDWYLALRLILAERGAQHRLVSIRRPQSPWIHPGRWIDIPWPTIARACLDSLRGSWAGAALSSQTIPTTYEQTPCA